MSHYPLSKEALLRQILLALCSSLGLLATGLIRGYSSPGIPSMNQTTPWIIPDESAKSWIVSVPPLGSFIGCLVAMPWMHFMGRKRVIQIIALFFALSWMGIAISNTTNLLIFFRACLGVTGGVTVPAVQVYVSECSHPKVRGLLASLPSVSMVLGVLVQYFFGYVWDWRGMAWASSVFPVILIALLIPFPESPPWLKLNGMRNCDEAYRWFGIRPDLEHAQELDEEENDTTENNIVENDRENSPQKPPFFSRGTLVPLSLALAAIIFQQTCGNDIITYNTVELFRKSGSTLNDYLASLIFGVVHFAFVTFSIFFVDKYGRRTLLIFSALAMGLSMLSLSAYFYLQKRGSAGSLTFLPSASIMVYIASYSLGFCTVPLILFGEIFPLAYRSILGPFTMSAGVLAMFIELKTFDDLSRLAGLDGAFALYAFFNFFAVAYIYMLLPETKGKSLEEIEVYFSKRQNKIKLKSNYA